MKVFINYLTVILKGAQTTLQCALEDYNTL